ncbi:alkaline phosphatase D family protein [Streptomyces globisporus]|uniref:alkaline phosphatase D family protein n=1 Tax=Streptomyces globisporus TaxID=1908 RepID=UPI0037FC7C37
MTNPDAQMPHPAAPNTSRRAIVKAAAATTLLASVVPSQRAAADTAPPFSYPAFLHSVASGDPLPDGVLLWTRITPSEGATPGSGKGLASWVAWEVATDREFTTVVAQGTTQTSASADHTVKADVRGLKPSTTYFYRFIANQRSTSPVISPIGRTKTAPGLGSTPDRLRFGVVSYADWQAGYFVAYRWLSSINQLDAVLHLGDYIYEYGAQTVAVRKHEPAHDLISLSDYRTRHGQYKRDKDLQSLHEMHPVIAIWDDHEFANNTWTGGAGNHTEASEGSWTARRDAAKRAYFEWMPVRASTTGTVFRRLQFGKLVDLHMLDLRSFRTIQAPVGSVMVDDPAGTITGREQLNWLKNGLSSSSAQWKFVGTSVMISPITFGSTPANLLGPIAELLGIPKGGFTINPDQWDGYTDDRRELLNHLVTNRIQNTVFLSGDVHMAFACDVPLNAAQYDGLGSIASEFTVTSVTSANVDDILGVPPHSVSGAGETALRNSNPHIKWIDMDSHGLGIIDVTAERAQMDYFTIDKANKNSPTRWTRSFATRSGTQMIKEAEEPVGT